MLRLVIKDFRANWKYVALGLGVLFALSSSFMYTALKAPFSVDPDLLIYFLLVIVSSVVFTLLFLMIEQLYNTNIIFASLPISRRQFVVQRYVATYLQLLLGFGFHFIGLQIGIYFSEGIDQVVEDQVYNPRVWLLVLLFVMSVKAFSMPFYFKHGLRKGILIIGLVQCFSCIAFVYIMMSYTQIWDALQRLIFTVISFNSQVTIPICIGVTVLFLWISTQVSILIYKSKDL